MIRTYDEAHLTRLLRAKLEEHGGNTLACDRALGLPRRYVYMVLNYRMRLSERGARALGFRQEVPGKTRVRPMRYVRLNKDDESPPQSERGS